MILTLMSLTAQASDKSNEHTTVDKSNTVFVKTLSFDIGDKNDCERIKAYFKHPFVKDKYTRLQKETFIQKICYGSKYNPNSLTLSLHSNSPAPENFESDINNPFNLPDLGKPKAWGANCLKPLIKNTNYVMPVLLGGFIGLVALPEDVTTWTPEQRDPRNFTDNYSENLKAGPVQDEDSGLFNYILHPYVGGGIYYMTARTNGCSAFKSFLYSFTMSTFAWEYGLEALAEIPSSTDIIITPGIGALVGEAFYRIEKIMLSGNREVLGSRLLGEITLNLLNPIKKFKEYLDRNDMRPIVGVQQSRSPRSLNDEEDELISFFNIGLSF